MSEIIVKWASDRPSSVKNINELDELLDHVQAAHKGKPALIELCRETNTSLFVAVGDAEYMLHIEGKAEPSLTSVGDSQLTGAAIFYCGGQWTEVPRKNLVPVERARAAIRHWATTGEASSDIIWSKER
jgi:hypothetical protein